MTDNRYRTVKITITCDAGVQTKEVMLHADRNCKEFLNTQVSELWDVLRKNYPVIKKD